MNRTQQKVLARRHEQGISLIELMVVMAILTIMATFALPGVENSVSAGYRATGLMDAMAMIDNARSNAITHRQPVAVCASSDQQSCNSDNWEDGWLMFIDDGHGGKARDGKRSSSEQVLSIGEAATVAITIRSRQFSNAGAMVFDEVGMTDDSGSLVICDANDGAATVLDISAVGQTMRENSNDFTCS